MPSGTESRTNVKESRSSPLSRRLASSERTRNDSKVRRRRDEDREVEMPRPLERRRLERERVALFGRRALLVLRAARLQEGRAREEPRRGVLGRDEEPPHDRAGRVHRNAVDALERRERRVRPATRTRAAHGSCSARAGGATRTQARRARQRPHAGRTTCAEDTGHPPSFVNSGRIRASDGKRDRFPCRNDPSSGEECR